MREMKFMVWDGTDMRIVEMTYADYNCGFILGHDGSVDVKNLIWLQYIDRKDGSGVEIYEGWIVEFKANYCYRDRNGWHKGVIEWDQNRVGFVIKVPGYDDPFMIDDETDEFYHKSKVIGNVYEHHELLHKPEPDKE